MYEDSERFPLYVTSSYDKLWVIGSFHFAETRVSRNFAISIYFRNVVFEVAIRWIIPCNVIKNVIGRC